MTNRLFSPAQAIREAFPGRHAAFLHIVLVFLLCFVAACPLSAQSAHKKTNARIMVIFSEHSSSEICMELSQGFFNELGALGVSFTCDQIELHSLDDPRNEAKLDAKLDAKADARDKTYKEDIVGGRYDLIVAFGEPAARTLAKILPDVPETTAVILSCMKSFSAAQLRLSAEWREIHRNTTAVIRKNDPRPNINFGLKLFPDRKHVILLVSPFSLAHREYETLSKEYEGKCDFIPVEIEIGSDQERINASGKIAGAPDDSFIVSCDWDLYLPDIGSRAVMWPQLMQGRPTHDLPIIGRRQSIVRDYAVGGYISQLQDVGKETATISGYILNSGRNAGDIDPVTVGEMMDIADAGAIMPPKSTWFEPKLRSGLFVHVVD